MSKKPQEGRKSALATSLQRAVQRRIKGVEYFASLGPPVGQSPKDVLHRHGPLSLVRYRSTADEVYRVPILFICPASHRAGMMDIAPGFSLFEYLLNAGYDLFAMEWGPARPEDKHMGLDHYADIFVRESISVVQRETGEDQVTIMGYCAGGILGTIYTAMDAQDTVKNLVCFTTPIRPGKLQNFAPLTQSDVLQLDKYLNSVDVVPIELTDQIQNIVDPGKSTATKLSLWNNMWNDKYVHIYRLLNRVTCDTLPMPVQYLRDFIIQLARADQLYKGTLKVGGKRVSLDNIRNPSVLHIVGAADTYVQRDASQPLIELVRSKDKLELEFEGGHFAVVVGPNAVRTSWPAIDEWLSERSE